VKRDVKENGGGGGGSFKRFRKVNREGAEVTSTGSLPPLTFLHFFCIIEGLLISIW